MTNPEIEDMERSFNWEFSTNVCKVHTLDNLMEYLSKFPISRPVAPKTVLFFEIKSASDNNGLCYIDNINKSTIHIIATYTIPKKTDNRIIKINSSSFASSGWAKRLENEGQ